MSSAEHISTKISAVLLCLEEDLGCRTTYLCFMNLLMLPPDLVMPPARETAVYVVIIELQCKNVL